MNKRLRYFGIAAAVLAAAPLAGAAFAQGRPPMPSGAGGYPHYPGRPMPQASAPQTFAPPAPPSAPVKDVTPTKGESFFIVASVDLSKFTLLLKRPTEVTLLVQVTDKTEFVDESGKSIKISDFRAGDTVWMTSSGNPAEPTAVRVRKGRMTIADLHRYYLDYPEIK